MGNRKIIQIFIFSILFVIGVCMSSYAGDNAVGGGIDTASKQVWQIQLNKGGYSSGSGVLEAALPTDYDAVVSILIGTGTYTHNIIDCCIMGDTMIGVGKMFTAGGAKTMFGSATSPQVVTFSAPVTTFGIGLVIQGYTNTPGGFPAGYDWNASFN